MCAFSNSYNKKGQFTLFVIVAIVILFSFAFVIYAKNKVITAQMIAQADRQIQEYIDKYSIDQYVTSCLDAVSEEVIIKMMIQGGELNFTDDSAGQPINYITFNDTIYNITINVSVAVDANYNCPDGRPQNTYIVNHDEIFTETKDYPYSCGYIRLNEVQSKYDPLLNYGPGPCQNNCSTHDFNRYSGFFGVNNLSRLCDSNGKNKPGIVSGSNSLTCDYYDYYGNSIQQKIEREIEKRISDCINFSEIRERSSGNSNITRIGNATAVLTFTKGGYNIKLLYPFTILMSNRQPITRMIDFGIDKDMPIKELYEYAYELLNYDVIYPDFNIFKKQYNVTSKGFRRSGQNVRLYNYSVDLIRGDVTNNYTDVARIMDNEHKINGAPLLINVAIKQRRPFLDFIHYTESQLFDVVSVENQTIILSPKGYDPDDDTLSYNYSGWLEDYEDIYSTTQECLLPSSLTYIIENCMIPRPDLKPENWTNSSMYKDTLQNASYRPMFKDRGFHKVNVLIVDEHGLKDSQVIKILIFDLPHAEISIDPVYPDVPEGFASYEDLFNLNGGESYAGAIADASGLGLGKMIWNDTLEPFAVVTDLSQGYDTTLNLPYDNMTESEITGLNMLNIINYAFKKNPFINSTAPIPHNIKLTVVMDVTGLTDTTSQEVNVTQCLNHRNPNNPSYPYNINPQDLLDSLNADHTCCTDIMTYAGTTTQCFENIQYGLLSALTNYGQNDYVPFGEYGTYISHNTHSIIPDYTDNDIYMQEFIRYCSGNRGNICSGDGDNFITPHNACNDNNYGTGGDERCSGPLEATSPNSMECTIYSETTFEQQFGLPEATGNCNNQRACSEGNGGTYNNGGKYSCVGQCDSSGGCTIATDCRCDSYQGCGTDYECNGVIGTQPIQTTCRVGTNGGTLNVRKTCSQCGLIDATDKKCISGGANGCNAASQCNNREYNTAIPGHPDQGCSPTCQFIQCNQGLVYIPELERCGNPLEI